MFSFLKKITKFAPQFADVAELVDAPDLGSGATRRGGSSPFVRTAKPPTFLFLWQVLAVIYMQVFEFNYYLS